MSRPRVASLGACGGLRDLLVGLGQRLGGLAHAARLPFDRPAGEQADADAAAGPGLDPAADGVGYRQVALWLDDEEFTGLVTELRAVLTARLALEPDGARRRRIVSQVFLPG